MNKLYVVQILFTVLTISVGCSDKSSETISVTIVDDFPETIAISGTPIESMKEKHYGNSGLMIIDSFLVVMDMHQEKPIFVYSTKTHELLGTFSSVGRGPGEFISPTIIKHSELNTFLNIYDTNLGIIIRIDIAGSIEKNQYLYTSSSINDELKKDRLYRVFYESKDFSWIEKEGQWFSFYNERDNTFIDIPFPKLDFSIPDQYNYYLFHPEVCYNPVLSKVVASSSSIGYLSFYDTIGKHLNTINFDFDPGYMKELKSLNIDKEIELKHCIGNMQADDQYIYAVNFNYKGQPTEVPDNNEILVFDWNGLPVKRINLDRGIGAVVFDHDNKKMYGYGTIDDYPVIEYDMTVWGL